jgi:hypothetical protein
MAIRVKLNQIVRPTHLTVFATSDLQGNEKVRMDIFSGWLNVNFPGGGGAVHREDCRAFLVNGKKNIFRFGNEADLLDVTVMMTTSSVADDDDEANVAAVDHAFVVVQPQTFPGIGGTQDCPILQGRLATLNAQVHGVAYHVVILSRPTDVPEDQRFIDTSNLPPTTAPA